MDITVKRQHLLKAVSTVNNVVSRVSLPILSNVLIKATDNTIRIVATDLETMIESTLDSAIIRKPGAITASARKLQDLLQEFDAPSVRLITKGTGKTLRLMMQSGNGVYTIIGLPDEEFPYAPKIVTNNRARISGAALRNVLHRTIFAASTEEVRYFLNGCYFNCLQDNLEVVATDGRQLALAQTSPINLPGTVGFILPLKACHVILSAFSESESVEIVVTTHDNEPKLVINDGICKVITRLVEGEYPKYEKIVPKPESAKGSLIIDRLNLLRAVRRVSILSNPKNYSVCLKIDAESSSMRISAKTPELGEAIETVSLIQVTDSLRIGFDARLLIDALAHVSSERVRLDYTEELDPVVIKPTHEAGHLVLVMPMRLES